MAILNSETILPFRQAMALVCGDTTYQGKTGCAIYPSALTRKLKENSDGGSNCSMDCTSENDARALETRALKFQLIRKTRIPVSA